jgi:hypothetical protein
MMPFLTAMRNIPILTNTTPRMKARTRTRKTVTRKTSLLSSLPPHSSSPSLLRPPNHLCNRIYHHPIRRHKLHYQQHHFINTPSMIPPTLHIQHPLPLRFLPSQIPLLSPHQPSSPQPLRVISQRLVHLQLLSPLSAQLIPLLPPPQLNFVTRTPSQLKMVSVFASLAYPPPLLPPLVLQPLVPQFP